MSRTKTTTHPYKVQNGCGVKTSSRFQTKTNDLTQTQLNNEDGIFSSNQIFVFYFFVKVAQFIGGSYLLSLIFWDAVYRQSEPSPYPYSAPSFWDLRGLRRSIPSLLGRSLCVFHSVGGRMHTAVNLQAEHARRTGGVKYR